MVKQSATEGVCDRYVGCFEELNVLSSTVFVGSSISLHRSGTL